MMMNSDTRQLSRRIRILIGIVIVGLVVSGLTAFPLLHEIDFLQSFATNIGAPEFAKVWIANVHDGLHQTNAAYPFMAYGTDWLAFGHIVIALFFLGALIDPVRNIWIIRAGQIACVLVIPLAFICGEIRGIPLWWRAIDSAFGVLGFIPLWLAAHWIGRLQDLNSVAQRESPLS